MTSDYIENSSLGSSKKDNTYSAEAIQVMKGLMGVRKNPGMYIGDFESPDGLRKMLEEVVDNCIDEHLAGHCTEIDITIHADNFITVKDNGRGIPVDIHSEGISALEVVMTNLHAGGKFDKKTYEYSAGRHGVGISVITALSSRLDVYSSRNGHKYHMAFEKGNKATDIHIVENTYSTGTEVIFKPDEEIFGSLALDYNTVHCRLEELSFLNPKLVINFEDKRQNIFEKFFYQGGITEYLEKTLQKNNTNVIEKILYVKGNHINNNIKTEVECSFGWTDSKEVIRAFTNTVYQEDGGAHVTGFRTVISKVFLNYIEQNIKSKSKIEINADDVREGVAAIISIKLSHPNFTSQTKSKLSSQEARQAVEKVVGEFFDSWLDNNPKKALVIYENIKNNANIRRKMKDVKEGEKLDRNMSPKIHAKFLDCQRNNDIPKELFIVEGKSARGPVERSRDSRFQAVYSLRGKILNVEKSTEEAALRSEEIRDLFSIIGAGFGEKFNIEKIRFDKIIILTDADVDGGHIFTLVATALVKYGFPLLLNNHVYAALPPLYDVETKNGRKYVRDDKELNKILIEIFNEKYYVVDKNNCSIDVYEFLQKSLQLIEEMRRKIGYQNTSLISYLCSYNEPFSIENDLPKVFGYFKPGNWHVELEDDVANITYNSSYEKSLYQIKYDVLKYFIDNFSFGNIFPVTAYSNGKVIQSFNNFYSLYNYINDAARKNISIRRNKGLGEMQDEILGMTAIDPETRVLLSLKVNNKEEVQEFTSNIIGKDVRFRKKLIEENAGFTPLDI